MNFKRVVITGLGTINPLGHIRVAEFWENLERWRQWRRSYYSF